MIRGASLLKDGDATGNPEVDELRADIIKQKIVFEAELRRQREVSDERFDGVQQQLLAALEDNAQLRRTLHGLGDRIALLEQKAERARSMSPMTVNADGSVATANTNSSGLAQQKALLQRQSSSAGRRQASPVPRGSGAVPQPQPQPQPHHHVQHSGLSIAQQQQHTHFVKIRPSPTPTTTPKLTPRQPITRATSNVSAISSNVSITSPAHTQFRPVLRSTTPGSFSHQQQQQGANPNRFRSPMRQAQAAQVGKNTNPHLWR